MNLPLAMLLRLRFQNGEPLARLAKEFGIQYASALQIRHGDTYGNTPGCPIYAHHHWVYEVDRLEKEAYKLMLTEPDAYDVRMLREIFPSRWPKPKGVPKGRMPLMQRKPRPRWATKEAADLARARGAFYQVRQWLKTH